MLSRRYAYSLRHRWPKGIAKPGRDVEAMVSMADYAPTFLDAAGVKLDRPLTGKSLLPFLRNEPAPADWRDAIFTQSNGNEQYGIQRSVDQKVEVHLQRV